MIVPDTHVLVWWLTQAPGLSTAAKRAIAKRSAEGGIVASAISALEIATAVRRGRLQFTVPAELWLADMRCIPELRLEPMHGDPADRIIAATATVLGADLVTADDKLRSLPALRSIW